jgi:hypothetical protein
MKHSFWWGYAIGYAVALVMSSIARAFTIVRRR